MIFGFHEFEEVFNDETKVHRFSFHAQYFVRMLDKALNLLGPDVELLTDILMELGAKHVQYGKCPTVEQRKRFLARDWCIAASGMCSLFLKFEKGVRPEYFPSMGYAIFYTVEQLLGKKAFHREIKDAWVEVYGAMSYDMILGQQKTTGKRESRYLKQSGVVGH